MEQKKQIMAPLLHSRECPVGYKCQATDCIECLKIHMEKGAANGAEKTAD